MPLSGVNLVICLVEDVTTAHGLTGHLCSFARLVNCKVTMASRGLHRIIGTDDGCKKANATGECK